MAAVLTTDRNSYFLQRLFSARAAKAPEEPTYSVQALQAFGRNFARFLLYSIARCERAELRSIVSRARLMPAPPPSFCYCALYFARETYAFVPSPSFPFSACQIQRCECIHTAILVARKTDVLSIYPSTTKTHENRETCDFIALVCIRYMYNGIRNLRVTLDAHAFACIF